MPANSILDRFARLLSHKKKDTSEELWHDREIRFDLAAQHLEPRSGEYVIAALVSFFLDWRTHSKTSACAGERRRHKGKTVRSRMPLRHKSSFDLEFKQEKAIQYHSWSPMRRKSQMRRSVDSAKRSSLTSKQPCLVIHEKSRRAVCDLRSHAVLWFYIPVRLQKLRGRRQGCL